jgi:hypothetical protein
MTMSDQRSLPSLLHQIFNPDSRKVGFGWWLFIVSTWLRHNDKIESLHWLACAALATILIGGGTVVDDVIKAVRGFFEAKFGGGTPAPAAAAARAATPPAGAQP